MSGKKRASVQNLGGSGLDIVRYRDGSVSITYNFDSIYIDEEHLGVIGSYLVRLYEDE